MRMGNGDNWLDLERGTEGGDGDVLVLASVQHSGFSGSIDTWIVRAAWDAFVADLRRLDERRQGVATVESISPGELSITIKSLDGLGHLGVEGELGLRGDRLVSLRFSKIEFDPTSLPGIVAGLSRW